MTTDVLYSKNMVEWYDELYFPSNQTKKELKFLDKIFKKFGIRKILDIACGTGRHSIGLKKMGYDVVGVDSSKPMVDYAKNKSEKQNLKIRYYQMDMKNVKLREKFDAVIIMGSFMYLIDNDDVIATLNSINKLLKLNGLVMIELDFVWKSIAKGKFKKYVETVKRNDKKMIIRLQFKVNPLNNTYSEKSMYERFIGKKRLPIIKGKIPKLRILFPDEFDLFFKLTGFELLEIYGNFGLKAKLSEKNYEKLIVLGRKVMNVV
ncbi:MAG: class I SAM-dependent methyltransferase [Candidatus Aenigmarchaeota archaeon]|nr:class I SAM-dependent methyltransferase [Candidatus Aenigmarchaeota archaeon]